VPARALPPACVAFAGQRGCQVEVEMCAHICPCPAACCLLRAAGGRCLLEVRTRRSHWWRSCSLGRARRCARLPCSSWHGRMRGGVALRASPVGMRGCGEVLHCAGLAAGMPPANSVPVPRKRSRCMAACSRQAAIQCDALRLPWKPCNHPKPWQSPLSTACTCQGQWLPEISCLR